MTLTTIGSPLSVRIFGDTDTIDTASAHDVVGKRFHCKVGEKLYLSNLMSPSYLELLTS